MKDQPGKNPTIRWYYKDWLADKKLQRASPSSRGIWMNLLMHMVDCSLDGDDCQEGILEDLTIIELMSLGSCTEDQAWSFLDEALKHQFCDVQLNENVTFTIMSRRLSRDIQAKKQRLSRDSHAREQNRKRKQKQRDREKKKNSHADVTDDVTGLSRPISRSLSKSLSKSVQKQTQKKTPLPPLWGPDPAQKKYALDHGVAEQHFDEFAASFVDYHISRGNKMLDWGRAWQTFCRNAVEYSKQYLDPKRKTKIPVKDLPDFTN